MDNKVATTPTILWPGKFDDADVANLKAKAGEIIDIYETQLGELFRVEHPEQKDDNSALKEYIASKDTGDTAGAWVYYPWKNALLHCTAQEELFRLRTNRNKNLINSEEQSRLADVTVGITGMSVGAGIALSLVYSGVSNTIKISDFDVLDTSNLNRLREGLLSVGKNKITLAAQHIYELDPFLNVHQYAEGINSQNITGFFEDPPLNIVVDEIDDFKMKVQLRMYAKKRRIPVIMFTSLGDNILVDIERYDTDAELQPFHGLLGNTPEEILQKDTITTEDIRKFSVQLVGKEYIPTRALESVAEMGKSIVGRPQLYSTIAVDGGLAAYVIRQIILNNEPVSGRYFVNFAELFKLENDELKSTPERENILTKLSG